MTHKYEELFKLLDNHKETGIIEFFQKKGILQLFSEVCTGLNIQYNANLTENRVLRMNMELGFLFGEEKFFLAMWSSRSKDEEFDSAKNLLKWLELFDGVNTDFPNNFWN